MMDHTYLWWLPVDGGVIGEDVGEFQRSSWRRRFVNNRHFQRNLHFALVVLNHDLIFARVASGCFHHLQVYLFHIGISLKEKRKKKKKHTIKWAEEDQVVFSEPYIRMR